MLTGLGFNASEAAIALEMAQGDLAKAIEFIEKPSEINDDEETVHSFSLVATPKKAPARRARVRRAAYAAYLGDDGETRGRKGRGKNVHKLNADDIPPAKNEVNLWTDEPFLVNLYNYINMRFITCPGYCLICDRDLDITTYKLPVCGRAECVR